jgi:hypothetical protein
VSSSEKPNSSVRTTGEDVVAAADVLLPKVRAPVRQVDADDGGRALMAAGDPVGFAPAEFTENFHRSRSEASSRSPHRSANCTTGTKPANLIRFGSSNRADTTLTDMRDFTSEMLLRTC